METCYVVQGMKCGGCVAKATEALAKLPGYEDAEFDLKSGIALGAIVNISACWKFERGGL